MGWSAVQFRSGENEVWGAACRSGGDELWLGALRWLGSWQFLYPLIMRQSRLIFCKPRGEEAKAGALRRSRNVPENTEAPGYRPGAFACWVSLVLDGVRETETILTDRRLAVSC